MTRFSWRRMAAIFIKERQQMLRDRLTFAMAVGVPILQLVLFGYAINTDPKGLPTAIVAPVASDMSRSLAAALQNSGYFRLVATDLGEREADARLLRGERVAAFTGIRAALAPGDETVLLPVSAVSGEGMRELWKSITDFLAGQIPPEP